MSTNYSDSDKTYRIETSISSGRIDDPITDESHEIVPDETSRGGSIEVPRPDSAHALVEGTNSLAFAGEPPTQSEVADAQKARFEFADNDVCMNFAESYRRSFERMNLGPSEGFDPKEGYANNDPRIKAAQMYQTLQERGYEAEAAYLRALSSESAQSDFCDYLREHEAVRLYDN